MLDHRLLINPRIVTGVVRALGEYPPRASEGHLLREGPHGQRVTNLCSHGDNHPGGVDQGEADDWEEEGTLAGGPGSHTVALQDLLH